MKITVSATADRKTLEQPTRVVAYWTNSRLGTAELILCPQLSDVYRLVAASPEGAIRTSERPRTVNFQNDLIEFLRPDRRVWRAVGSSRQESNLLYLTIIWLATWRIA